MIFLCFNCSPLLFSSFGPENSIHYGGPTVLYCVIYFHLFYFHFSPYPRKYEKNVDLRYTQSNMLHRHVHYVIAGSQDAKPSYRSRYACIHEAV